MKNNIPFKKVVKTEIKGTVLRWYTLLFKQPDPEYNSESEYIRELIRNDLRRRYEPRTGIVTVPKR